MPLIHVALQEGFADDPVTVRVNNKEIFRKEHVKTRLQISYADSIEVKIPEGSANVEVILSQKGLADSIEVPVTTDVYIGVSVLEGRIHFHVSREPFGYV